MAKIGIITIHHSVNYGACLQSYGLYKYIESLGFECEIINLRRPMHDDYNPSKKYIRFRPAERVDYSSIKFWLKSMIPNCLRDSNYYKNKSLLESRNLKFAEFNKKIKLSSRTYTCIDDLYANPPFYDIYITGSDQVWNPMQPFCIEPYFLTFVKNPKARKISYAASIGLSELRKNVEDCFRKWLSTYNAITVREKEGKQILEKIIDTPVDVVLDPTFLVGPEHWHSLAVKPQINEPYILVFKVIARKELVDYATKIGLQSGKRVIVLPSGEDGEGRTIIRNAGPEEYLGWFANADMVITDSFHGGVFSILMGAKNFFESIPRGNKKGSRIVTLFNTFELADHILSPDLNQTYDDLAKISVNRDRLMDLVKHETEISRQKLKQLLE